MQPQTPSLAHRRSFLARLAAGAGAITGGVLAGGQSASAQAPSAGTFRPARHAQDDWLDQVPGQHRFLFDTTTPDGFGGGLAFANNFYLANQSGYGLKDADVAVVIVARHGSTSYAYNDRIWAKYGVPLTALTKLNDPRTNQPATVNLFNNAVPGLSNRGILVDGLIQRGAHFAVCGMATRFIAGELAKATGGTADAVYAEITGNLVRNAHLMAAGILAVNRAQERGYTLATV